MTKKPARLQALIILVNQGDLFTWMIMLVADYHLVTLNISR